MPTIKPTETRTAVAEGVARSPDASRPWEDCTLSVTERYESYDKVLRAHVEGIVASMQRAGATAEERAAIRLSPETEHWVSELKQLIDEAPKDFCHRIEEGVKRELLGKNFLGAEAWKQGFGVDVGGFPPLPKAITRELLNSDCPLHSGRKIKDTHLLVLMPRTVDGESYSALKLDQLCATRKGSGDKLIYDGERWAIKWKGFPWASAPQAESEWVLLPKSDPDPSKVSTDKHFRSKHIAEQQKVHDNHYKGYREAKAVELMTAALLYDSIQKERLPSDCLRCKEQNSLYGRIGVGPFIAHGLEVFVGDGDEVGGGKARVGRALARKLKT